MKWITEGFDAFSRGTMENGGQNLYVSKKGVLQRIFQYDINQDGHPDILFGCSHSMYECPPLYVYRDALNDPTPVVLPSNGTYSGCLADLHGSGYEDLIVACQHNGHHGDIAAVLYFGNKDGLSEKYKMELPAPRATSVCAGDFNGDGKKEIMFVSHGKLRMFYQLEHGFAPCDFKDFDVQANAVVAADFDGDGICDIALKNQDGDVGILFGGKDGPETDNILWIKGCGIEETREEYSSTAGALASESQWRPYFISINHVLYLFTVNGDNIVLYTCNEKRQVTTAYILHCPHAVGVAAVDLTGDGYEDLAVAVYTDRDEVQACRIYKGSKNGIYQEDYETISIKGAVSVTAANLNGNKVIFCRTGENINREVLSPVVSLNAAEKPEIVAELLGGDCSTILAGHTSGAYGNDDVIMLNNTFFRGGGHEDCYVYLGGTNGYVPERKMTFPGHSAVGGAMVDFFDSGHVDVLIDNCYEDDVPSDHGSYIYRSEVGYDPARKVIIPTVRGHGSAIGDFRKCGYLDIASGGYNNREIRIFHGSEHGYSLDNCTKILLGPDTENYTPPKGNQADTPEERELHKEYGEVRWLLAADLNGDGWLDLFISEIVGPRCYILWGGPDGFSKERMSALYTDGVASAAVADLNADGYPDLILAQHMSTKKNVYYESYITVYWGGPDGYKENRRMQLPASCANSVTVGDFSGQGKLDLYAVSYQNSRTRSLSSYLYPNDGKGNFSSLNVQRLFTHSSCGCVAGDFNGDGYTDLAVCCHKEYGNHCTDSFIFWGGPEGLSEDRKTVLPAIGPHGMCTIDPGNIMDRGPREHYTSEIYTLPAGATVSSITWAGSCTSTSWVEVEMRAAATADAIEDASWQHVESGADISALNLSGVVQYRLALCAKCACGTPRIERVVVQYGTPII